MGSARKSLGAGHVLLALFVVSSTLLAVPSTLLTVRTAETAAVPGSGGQFPAPLSAVTGEYIVRLKPGTDEQALTAAFVESGIGRARFDYLTLSLSSSNGVNHRDQGNLVLVSLPGWMRLPWPAWTGLGAEAALKRLQAQEAVLYVQPNHVYEPCFAPPDDPLWSQLWGLQNDSYPAVDIDALVAWDRTTGDPAVVVGVLDGGIDTSHPDLAPNIWVNPGETAGDGVDNDGNGYIDDVWGWDFFWNDNTVFDCGFGDVHGTHVAGTIAAAMNNSTGGVGVAPAVKVMALKFMGPEGGTTAAAVRAIDYAIARGVKVINASWGSGVYDQALKDAIQAFGEAGGIFVAAAGNGDSSGYGYDTDVTPFYPACYDLPNIIAVAAVDHAGGLVRESNFGKRSVDLGAPGASIWSAVPSQEPAYGPAGLEVDDPAGYKAVVWGFGAESFTSTTAKDDAIARVVNFLGIPGGGKLLLVDDDESNAGGVDVRPIYVDALSPGYTLTVYEPANPDADGPGAAEMDQHDGVVWFTGKGWGWEMAPLTDNDLANLNTYLRDYGGRLFLSGRDAIFLNEVTDLIRNTLHVWDLGEWEDTQAYVHIGLAGTGGAFSGADYSSTWQGDGAENFIAPWGPSAMVDLVYVGGPYTNAYEALGNTSIAAPYVSGVAALLLSYSPEATAASVVQAITSTTTPLPVLAELTVTGGIVNAPRALDMIKTGATVSPESLDLAEGGPVGSYTVVLRKAPSADVTITATPDSQVIVDNGSGGNTLVFTASNWSTPQTMWVAAADDNVVEGKHTGAVSHVASGGDFEGVPILGVTVNLADNDTPVVTVEESDGLTQVSEGGTSDSYTVVLGAPPCGDVTVLAVPDEELTAVSQGGGNTLTFTPSNWNVPQTFTVHAVDDTDVEGSHSGVVAHAASGGGYGGAAIRDVTAAITDNDIPALVVTESGGATGVTEGGSDDTYTLVLSDPPGSDVTVTPSVAGGQVTVTPSDITFTTTDWDQGRTVTVEAVDDLVAEGLHADTVVYAAMGGGYAGEEVAAIAVTVTDNDSPGVALIESDGSTAVTEGDPALAGSKDTYQIVLTCAPSDTVTVTATAGSQVTVDNGAGGNTLTFTTSNWDLPQTLRVTVVDDAVVEGSHLGTVSHSASGGVYDSVAIADLSVSITDNDPAEVLITQTDGSTQVTEGAAAGSSGEFDAYTVKLARQPSGTVTITATPGKQVIITSPSGTNNLVFTTQNWNVAQTFTVRAVDDAIVEGPHNGLITHSSSGGGYSGAAVPTVTVAVTDNDPPGVTVVQSGGNTGVAEGGAGDDYTVVLDLQPAQNVTITAAPDTQLTVDNGSGGNTLTFTPANWNVPQTFKVWAVNDEAIEGSHHGVVTHAATGGAYTGVAIAGVTASIADNDSPGVSLVQSDGSTAVAEGGAGDSYTIVLTHVPSADVTVTVSTSGSNKVTVESGGGPAGSSTSLIFTTANWSTPQEVTVRAVDDGVVEGSHSATITHSAAGGGYDGVSIPSLAVSITDNDVPGVLITESGPDGGSTDVSEGGGSDTYTAVLTLEPSGTVTITLGTDAQLTATGPSGTNTLTFTTSNWNVEQTVTVVAQDDDVVEGLHSAGVTHTASGGGYFGVSIRNVTAAITDNDPPEVVIEQSDGSTAVGEGPAGATDSYTVALARKPCADVSVTVSAGDQLLVGKGAGSTPVLTGVTLTFTPSNYGTPQTVTVGALDDEVIEADPHTGTITHSATGGGYTGAAIGSVTASIAEDDFPGVSVAESDGFTAVTEAALPGAGETDTYTVVLTHVPNGDVTIAVTADSDVRVETVAGGGPQATASLTFTTADWSTPQTITVYAFDDDEVEGAHAGNITHSAAGGGYDGVPIAGVTVAVTDNDVPGITIIESDSSTIVGEGAGGATDTYEVRLAAKPSGTVTVTVTPDSQVTVAAGTTGPGSPGVSAVLTFTVADWNVPQTLTVGAAEDLVVEGVHSGLLQHSAAGGGYDGITADLTVTVGDDDLPGVTVTETGGSTAVTEGVTSGEGASDTYDVVLNLEPCATVTITVTASPENQVTLSSGGGVPSPSLALTFTPQDWNVPQTVTVRAVDDGVVEGSSSPQASVSLAHAASGGGYDGAAVDAVSVAVTDNDLPQVVVAESGNSTAVDEASTAYDTYTIHLGREPFDDVTVTVTVGDGQTLVEVEAGGAGTGVGSSAILVFTPSDWDVAQTIRVHPVNDDVVEGQHTGLISHAATGGGYDGCAIDDVTVAVADNDAGGVTIVESEDRTQVAEGGAGGPALDTYQVLLTMQPSGDVTITAAPSADLTVDNGSAGNTLVFTPVNWNLPQTITVAAVDDGEAEGLHTGTVSHTAAGGGYTGASVGTVTVFITDNDPGVVVTESGGATAVREGGLTDTYIIALSTQPAGTVTVTVTPDGQLTVDCGTGPGSPGVAGQVTFTTSDWSDPRTITVAAADDLTVEGVHAGVVTHSASSGDPDYDAIAAPPVNVTITDNDSEAPPYEPPPPAPEPGPEPATGVRVVDPARDTTLRFAELGLTIHFPAGFVAVEPGDEIRVSARAAGPPDPVTLEGTHRTAGGNFELTVVRCRAGTTTSVYEFARTVTAVVDLRATAPRGVVADKIGLYVWEAGSLGPPSWVYVHSGYDSGSGRLIARLAHASRFAALVATRTFDDIQTHWARQEIEVLTGRKVIQGVAPWAFAPGDLVTRAQFCALLVRALGLEVSTSGTTPFADVPATAWYAPEVRTAWEAGLATGSTGASFAPNRAITRQEIAVFLSRALEVTGFAVNLTSGDVAELLAPFSDAGLVPGWARGPFAQVLAQGIVRGRTSTTLAPGGTATRAEAAVMLKRLMARTMDVAATATGVLQVSDVGGRHFELIVAGQVAGDRVLGGQVYTLLVDPGNTALLADLEARVGATVTLAGTVRPEAITIYQRGVPFVVYAVIG